ncbi:hypothetical protein P7K49_032692 [Saguinus oedipus]|uniref:Uncharacterized protein n=1 Tax=Saguinus oedipus TaxID=9490 RepID=A0ABQ9TQK0_SAGOE|nr:hypothetical protein P7K49_032692 [Saguinus oedipus]
MLRGPAAVVLPSRAQPLHITWFSILLRHPHCHSRQPDLATCTLLCSSPGLPWAPAVLPTVAVGPGATALPRTLPAAPTLRSGPVHIRLLLEHPPSGFKGHLFAPSLHPVMEDGLNTHSCLKSGCRQGHQGLPPNSWALSLRPLASPSRATEDQN